jgi:hypothetical protein
MIGIGATLFKRAVMGSRGFSPSTLFASGEEGAWYDPSDLSTLFEEDGTTLASVNGPVGKILDKSGNGNHLIQTTETKCPTLKLAGGLYYLEFDGVDDGLQSAAIDFTGTDSMSVFAGARKEADEVAVIGELSVNVGNNNGTFRLASLAGNIWRYSSKGTSVVNANSNEYSPPVTSVLTGLSDISDDVTTLRVDGVQKSSPTSNQGTGNYGNHSLNVGARSNATSLQLEGNIYGLIVRGVMSNAAEIAATETYIAAKTGVSI